MAEQELLQLCGTVEEVIFRNHTNGYTVLTVMNHGAAATAVGMMAGVEVGDEVKLIGNWKNHASYGEQFAFECYEQSLPSGAEGILKYLSSGVIKGIGRATAKKMVETFGEHTLDVMRNDPQRLTQIKGFSQERALAVSEEMKKTFSMREIMLELEGYRISVQEAVKIWKAYGTQAVELIKENPYILCREEVGIDFQRADHIAARLGRTADEECRIRAGLQYVLSQNVRNGHTCLPKDRMMRVTAEFLMLSEEQVLPVVEAMLTDGSLVSHLMGERLFLFQPSFYRSESYAAERLHLMKQFPPEAITGIEAALTVFEQRKHIHYADLQRKAITEALSGGLLILTGGPGTGKTTTLNAIMELYRQCGMKVLLAAPTGRAAQRMSAVTGRTAQTLHRLLEVEWDKNDNPAFKRNERNLLDCDALIIDELSMVDAVLFESMMRALPLGCRLILVGDSDQLPSVGAGNVLGDLIASGEIPVVQLTEIFRQSLQSLIVTNAHRIVHGAMPEITRTDSDFFFMAYSDRNTVMTKIVELCASRLPHTYGYSPFEDIQVLCPGRKGELGVIKMNTALQSALNPHQPGMEEVKTEHGIFRVGDKVMQIKNNYDLLWTKADGTAGTGIFNGDIGLISLIDKKAGLVYVQFDDKTVEYNTEVLNHLELAYATTVHKSQGNEFNAVIIPMHSVPAQLCYRNLLYTAVTRAKKMLILVGEVGVMKSMIDNDRKTLRYSGLQYFLKEQAETEES